VLPAALRGAAACLAQLVGADGEDLAFVCNGTMDCNAVLRSLPLVPDDEILCLDHAYNAVRDTMRYIAAKRGARLVVAELPFPCPDRAEVIARLDQALDPRTRLNVLDHISSPVPCSCRSATWWRASMRTVCRCLSTCARAGPGAVEPGDLRCRRLRRQLP
jgi:isopenicillin-N epimerase